jgi:putative NADPH-quinone reductase
MTRRIAIIQGRPSPGGHFCHALAAAYTTGAAEGGHDVRQITVAELDFPVLRTREEWEAGTPPPSIAESQATIAWAEHLVIIYPLWLGTMPALLKVFLEQLFRPGFGTSSVEGGKRWTRNLSGRTARIVVTMGMPALVYRWYYGAHSLKSLERNILNFTGVGPVRESLIGSVEAMDAAGRQKWLVKMRKLGQRGR